MQETQRVQLCFKVEMKHFLQNIFQLLDGEAYNEQDYNYNDRMQPQVHAS